MTATEVAGGFDLLDIGEPTKLRHRVVYNMAWGASENTTDGAINDISSQI